mmetsp:Transcript_30418/g.69034  ORF Transcript_30418/g.69034 Transcript_30418/m.69034 type:complete len:309 (+) Transcript_30418:750-1676(+)
MLASSPPPPILMLILILAFSRSSSCTEAYSAPYSDCISSCALASSSPAMTASLRADSSCSPSALDCAFALSSCCALRADIACSWARLVCVSASVSDICPISACICSALASAASRCPEAVRSCSTACSSPPRRDRSSALASCRADPVSAIFDLAFCNSYLVCSSSSLCPSSPWGVGGEASAWAKAIASVPGAGTVDVVGVGVVEGMVGVEAEVGVGVIGPLAVTTPARSRAACLSRSIRNDLSACCDCTSIKASRCFTMASSEADSAVASANSPCRRSTSAARYTTVVSVWGPDHIGPDLMGEAVAARA